MQGRYLTVLHMQLILKWHIKPHIYDKKTTQSSLKIPPSPNVQSRHTQETTFTADKNAFNEFINIRPQQVLCPIGLCFTVGVKSQQVFFFILVVIQRIKLPKYLQMGNNSKCLGKARLSRSCTGKVLAELPTDMGCPSLILCLGETEIIHVK